MGRCNVTVLLLAITLAIMLATAGVLAVEGLQARPVPKAILEVKNQLADQVVTIFALGGVVVGVVRPDAEATFEVDWKGVITVVRQDGMKADVPCILPWPGRRQLSRACVYDNVGVRLAYALELRDSGHFRFMSQAGGSNTATVTGPWVEPYLRGARSTMGQMI